jgi:hypothetical protein
MPYVEVASTAQRHDMRTTDFYMGYLNGVVVLWKGAIEEVIEAMKKRIAAEFAKHSRRE